MLLPFMLMSLGAMLSESVGRRQQEELRRAVLGTLILSGHYPGEAFLNSEDGRVLLGSMETEFWLPKPEDEAFISQMIKLRAVALVEPQAARRMASALLGSAAPGALRGLNSSEDAFVILREYPTSIGYPALTLLREDRPSGPDAPWNGWSLGLDHYDVVSHDQVLEAVLWKNPDLSQSPEQLTAFRTWLANSPPGSHYEGLHRVGFVFKISKSMGTM